MPFEMQSCSPRSAHSSHIEASPSCCSRLHLYEFVCIIHAFRVRREILTSSGVMGLFRKLMMANRAFSTLGNATLALIMK